MDSPAGKMEEIHNAVRHNHRNVFALEGATHKKVFPNKELSDDHRYYQVACTKCGVDGSLAGKIMPAKIYNPNTLEEEGGV